MSKPSVFISATTGDLRTIRERVKQALLTMRCVPREQENFAPDYRSMEAMLRAQIKDCHAVIHLAGLRFGAEPKHRGDGQERRSYTQMEYHIARELKKPIYTFVCGKDFPYDECEPEDAERRTLQDRHRSLLLGDTHFQKVCQKEELDRKVREIDYRSHLRWTTRTMMVLSVLILLVAIASGYFLLQQFRQLVPIESADRLFDAKDYAGAFHAYVRHSDRNLSQLPLHQRIEECARRGKLQKAFLDRYLALVRKEPANPGFLNYLGNAYLMIDPNDKEGKAREHYDAALRFAPEFPPSMANLGILSFRQGKIDEAESLFRRYLTVEPGDAQAWVNLGLLYADRVQSNVGDTEAAVSCTNALVKAIRLEPGSFAAFRTMGRLFLTLGQTNESLRAYQTSLRLNPDQPDIRQLMEEQFPALRVEPSAAAETVTRGVE